MRNQYSFTNSSFELAEYIKPKIRRRQHLFADLTIPHLWLYPFSVFCLSVFSLFPSARWPIFSEDMWKFCQGAGPPDPRQLCDGVCGPPLQSTRLNVINRPHVSSSVSPSSVTTKYKQGCIVVSELILDSRNSSRPLLLLHDLANSYF
jgi:hypothetical protein